jgi:hypothetical protein
MAPFPRLGAMVVRSSRWYFLAVLQTLQRMDLKSFVSVLEYTHILTQI